MRGRLTARPVAPSEVPFGVPGLRRLGLRPDRDTVLYVPSSYDPTRPAPLVVSLHGAGGDASAGLALLRPAAEGAGLLVVAPSSERATWDVITGGFGPDVAAIDLVLRVTFARYAVDPARISVAGFSDAVRPHPRPGPQGHRRLKSGYRLDNPAAPRPPRLVCDCV